MVTATEGDEGSGDDHEQRVSRDLLCAIDLKDAVQPNHRDGLTHRPSLYSASMPEAPKIAVF